MARIFLSFNDDRHRLTSDLVEGEIFAVGQFTVAWAILEHLILLHTADLCARANIPLPDDAKSLSFKRRRRAFLTVIKKCVRRRKERDHFEAIANKAGSIEQSRNRITHGLWEWDGEDPQRVVASSFKQPFAFEEPFNFDKLIKLAEQVEELNFKLTYPRGQKQAMAEHNQEVSKKGWYISRHAALQLMANPPKHVQFFQHRVKAEPFVASPETSGQRPRKRPRKK